MGKTGICGNSAGLRDRQLRERGIIRVTREAIIIPAGNRVNIVTTSAWLHK